MTITPRNRFLLLVLLALVPRACFVLFYGPSAPPTPWGDDWHYDRIARQFLSTRVYSDGWFPPGYPLMLSGIYAVFGAHLAAVRAVQVCIGAATCGIVYLLGRRLYDERVGMVAGSLLAFYPPHVYFAWRIMAETTFVAVLATSALLAMRLLAEPRWWRATQLGASLGFGHILKSNLFVFPPLLMVWVAATLRRRSALTVVASATVPFLLFVGLVPVANFASGQGLTMPLPLNAGHTLWWANNPKANGYFVMVADSDPVVAPFIREQGVAGALTSAPRAEKDRIYQQLATTWIRRHPLAFLKLAPQKLLNAFSPLPMAALLESNGSAAAVYAVFYGSLLPFALYGLVISFRRPTPEMRVVHLILLSYAGMVVLFYGTPRFTLLIIPYLVLFAGRTLVTLASMLLARRQVAFENHIIRLKSRFARVQAG
jgi:4-amino-4-deoxy-L-arabinose transferase-like glycosyltransferase